VNTQASGGKDVLYFSILEWDPGQTLATALSDVLRRIKQKILVSHDIFSSYTTAVFISNEKAETLRSALLTTTSHLRVPSTIVRVDAAPAASQSLKSDKTLASHWIALDFGRMKNKNNRQRHPRTRKRTNLYRTRRKSLDFSHLKKLSTTSLRVFVLVAHHPKKSSTDETNHLVKKLMWKTTNFSVIKKSLATDPVLFRKAQNANVQVGDLVFVKHEGSKHKTREQYIVTNVTDHTAIVQKFDNSKFMSLKYELPLSHAFPSTSHMGSQFHDWDNHVNEHNSSDEDDSYSSDTTKAANAPNDDDLEEAR